MESKRMKVQWKRHINDEYVNIGLECGNTYADASPGQFVMVRIPGVMDPILSRPFSIHDVVFENDRVASMAILFKIVGKGTLKLARIQQGDSLEVLGPLGKGFAIPGGMKSVFVIGGGIGAAPLIFLIRLLEQNRISGKSIAYFAGGRSKDDLLCLDVLSRKTGSVHVTTDDGSYGEKGLVTEVLEKTLATDCPDMIYACGPMPMLKAVAGLAARHGVKCQVSMETVMACGLGACLGCAVKNKKHEEKYAHVCVDGLVFDLDNFAFEA
jgi:dihydroorotate dehydrogenase electron transfer subunit